jgi:hypothetical protein
MFGGGFLACFCEERKVAPAHCLVDFRVCVGYMRHIVGMLVRSPNVPFLQRLPIAVCGPVILTFF